MVRKTRQQSRSQKKESVSLQSLSDASTLTLSQPSEQDQSTPTPRASARHRVKASKSGLDSNHNCDVESSFVGKTTVDITNSMKGKQGQGKQSPPSNKKAGQQVDHQYNDGQELSAKRTNSRPNTGLKHSYSRLAPSTAWWICLVLVFVLSVSTRLYKIDQPTHVCWDETHFGKMGSYYINRTFFSDVHPPLGKMLIGFAGIMTGYNGSFAFAKPGDKLDNVTYVGMRVFCGLLGSSLAPLAYGSVWELSHSLTAALLAGLMVVFDLGLLVLSQYILLDPPLLFFIMACTFSLLKFCSMQERPFSTSWWFWMFSTGTFLACSIGVKFVGLFVVLLAGLTTLLDLWRLLGDLSLSMKDVVKHFSARVAGLIVLPLSLYLVIYYAHFTVLSKSGPGDGHYSSAFQSQLQGNPLHNASMPQHIAYGSVITIKNYRIGGGYLHSHHHLYPEGVGAKQQQVTAYTHKDVNNQWVVMRPDRQPDPKDPVDLVRNGDVLRLKHSPTHRNLHSHKVAAPMTPRHNQVTCYGQDGAGDANDLFRVEIAGGEAAGMLETALSAFRLIHQSSGCALHSHSKQLPKWGYEQLEVSCNPVVMQKNNLWNVEEVKDARLPNTSVMFTSPNFLRKFIESHAVQAQSNSGLRPKEYEDTSLPWQWPILYRGQLFSGGNYRVYLLGNPIIWWSSLVLMLAYFITSAVHLIRKQRGGRPPKYIKDYEEKMVTGGSWLLLGWALHYLPFWTMGRVLYFHHYFPALLFSIMLSAIVLDYLILYVSEAIRSEWSWAVRHTLLGVALSVIVYSFYLFSPIAYGMSGPLSVNNESVMYGLKWLDSWDF